jgi:GntR family transcriptional regulator
MYPESSRTREVMIKLLTAIESEEYREGCQLPAERKLADKLKVSRITVRRALQALQTFGYVERRPYAGTFVAPKHQRGLQLAPTSSVPFVPAPLAALPVHEHQSAPTKFHFDDVGETGHVIFLAPVALIAADAYLAEALQLPPRALVLRRLRLFTSADGLPYEIADAYYPAEPFADLLQLEKDEVSVEDWLAETYGRRPKHVVEMAGVRPASNFECQCLHIVRLSWVFDIERKVLDQDNRTLELARIVRPVKGNFLRREYDVESTT